MKKQCPKSKLDINKLKTFKLYALKALELGATINEIIALYEQNNPSASKYISRENKLNTDKNISSLSKSVRSRVSKSHKYLDILNNFIKNIDIKRYKFEILNCDLYTYKLEEKQSYKLCESYISEYVNSLVKKGRNTFEGFALLLLKDFNEFYKIFGNINKSENYIAVSTFIKNSYSTFGSYSYYLHIDITATLYRIYTEEKSLSLSNRDRSTYYEYKKDTSFNNLFNFKIDGKSIIILDIVLINNI